MIPSAEYQALIHLETPAASRIGDMWLCRRLGIVRVMNGHKRVQARRTRMNCFHLYHWGDGCLHSNPASWRDNDSNAMGNDPATGCSERWEYVGNIFDLLPYAALAGSTYRRGDAWTVK